MNRTYFIEPHHPIAHFVAENIRAVYAMDKSVLVSPRLEILNGQETYHSVAALFSDGSESGFMREAMYMPAEKWLDHYDGYKLERAQHGS